MPKKHSNTTGSTDMGDIKRLRERSETELQLAKEQQALEGFAAQAETSETLRERDLANQMLGQVQAAQTVGAFVRLLSLAKIKNIKENKLYRSLAGVVALDKDGNKIANVGTWEGFCLAIGTTRQKIDEDLANLETFGEEALTSLKHIGLGYRELRQLRRIPENDREAIINGEAIRVGDKEEIIALIDDLSAKHAREKATLEKRAADLQADLESARKVAADKNHRIDELTEQLHKQSTLKPDERVALLGERLSKEVTKACGALLGPEAAIKQIIEWEEAPRELKHACAQAVARLRIALDELQARYCLPVVELDVDDSWMSAQE